MRNYAWVVTALLAVFLFAGGNAFAQTSSGQIAGRVIDPDGGVVVGAQVTLTNQDTAARWTTRSDNAGLFVFPALQPGTYSISVEAAGFKDLQKRDLHLSASGRLSAGDLELQVGAVTETVSVTALATTVQTQSAERSALLDSNEMQHLSTPGRDTLALVRLLPGVVKNGEGADQLGTQSAGAVSGTREVSNSISLDGVNGNPRGGGNRFDTPLNMEAVSEVKVLLNNYQAEYGQSGGAIVNITTKAGTQNFHGEGYYFNRNEDYNANDTFNKSTVDAQHPNGLPRPRYRYNTIGYNLGGPIYWPGKFNANKNKLFFFFSQEIWPSKTPGTTRYFMMPTALEKQGDFSRSVDSKGDAVTLIDPKNCGTGNQNCLLDPTHINSADINPNTQALLKILPTGNATPLGTAPGGGLYNYVVQTPVDRPVDQQVLRLDFNVTDKWHVFFRGLNMSNNTKGPTDSPGLNAAMQWGPSFFYDTPARNAAVGITFAASPTLVNEFTAGYADWRERSGFVNPSDISKFQRGSSTGVNLGQLNPSSNPLNLIPNFTFGGGGTSVSNGFGIGPTSCSTGVSCAPEVNFYTRFPFNNNTGTWEYTDGLTKIWDKHTVKVGLFWQNGRYVQHPIGNQFNGTFSFNVTPSNATDSGYAYANALLGNYNSYTEGTRTVYAPKWKILEWYVQDNWRVTHKLTLDYGLRLSYDFPYTLDTGAGVTFVPSRYNAGQVPVLYRPVLYSSLSAAQKALCFPATLKSAPSSCAQNPNNPGDVLPSSAIGQFVSQFNFTGSVVNTDPTYPHSLRNSNGVLWGPRVGISFDPWGDGKTAIRAGFGIFYNLREDAGVVGDFATTAPVIGNTRVDLGNLANTFAANCNTLPGGCANVSALQGPQDTKIMPINHKIASTISTHFGIQRDLGFSTVLDVSYVGTFGRHLELTPNINEVPYLSQFQPQNIDPTARVITSLGGTVVQQAAVNDNFFRPFPGYATVDLREYNGTSNYNALQVALNRRVSKTLQFGVAYTWSKTMSYGDTSSTGTATDSAAQGAFAVYQDPRFWNYAEANIDRTHDLVAHWVYSLPKASNLWNSKVVKAVADNWEWSGIAEFVSGAPQLATITIPGVNFTGGGDGTRLLLFGSPYASSAQSSGTYQFLDVTQFRLPPIASTAIGVVNPSAIPSRSMPGITGRDTYHGPGTNNWDMTLAKSIHITERVNFELRCEAYNIFNHVSYDGIQNTATFIAATGQLDPSKKFGALTTDTRGPRILQLVGKITF